MAKIHAYIREHSRADGEYRFDFLVDNGEIEMVLNDLCETDGNRLWRLLQDIAEIHYDYVDDRQLALGV